MSDFELSFSFNEDSLDFSGDIVTKKAKADTYTKQKNSSQENSDFKSEYSNTKKKPRQMQNKQNKLEFSDSIESIPKKRPKQTKLKQAKLGFMSENGASKKDFKSVEDDEGYNHNDKSKFNSTNNIDSIEEDDSEKDFITNKNKTVEETYQKMEQHDHILARPDMYIGSTRRITEDLWVWDEQLECMIHKLITYSPGLYKIFDEVLVNAADNFQRDPKMKFIKVEIDDSEGSISIHNDGDGIPVEIHRKHGKYVPELIFGDLLTGSNFDDTEKKVTGGRNGLGAKLANIYSSRFIVETCSKGKAFTQIFTENMKRRQEPKINSTKQRDYTKITFFPDLLRFDGMTKLDEDIISLFKKRVIDIAGCNSRLKVFLNGREIPIKSFNDYVRLYFVSNDKKREIIGPEIIYDKSNLKRWEIAFCISDGEFGQISFVNSIWTIRGGNHVREVLKRITDFAQPKIKRKNRGTEVKASMIKNHCFIFINSLINNPEFDSQTKETLKSTISQWGTRPELGENFLNKIITKSGLIEQVLLWNQSRTDKVLKTTSSKKKGRLGLVKLTDANMAGTAESMKCILIITEGDSAKGLALSGLNIVGQDYYGVFPLRGKVMNVRDSKATDIVKNEELNNVKKALGLVHSNDYLNLNDLKSLRYGKIMIMTDQDADGSHIKGLFINFIHYYWPSLTRRDGFLMEFVTPIVKASKGDQTVAFFTMVQYQTWLEENSNNLKGWKIKYYKGLGTSEPGEMQEYFADLQRHRKEFQYKGAVDDESIKLAFDKDAADRRKEWLANFEPGTYLDDNLKKIPYSEFINKELIHFSLEDCDRSICSLIDGFKPGQRKIMYACFKRKLKNEIKIAQLGGYVLEHCAYHHGEVSLQTTIVGMAQNFVGSNNINLLEPVGNFGSRSQGGKDSAAARYIFTTLSPLTRYIFHPDDDEILDYLEEEGLKIQPKFYIPVVPIVLINGNSGIGTGWSSFVPNYNPSDVVENLRRLLNNQDTFQMDPWYRGFLGEIEKNEKREGSYTIRGKWHRSEDEDDCINITELPIGTWTQNYKAFLENAVTQSDEFEKKQKEKKSNSKKVPSEDENGINSEEENGNNSSKRKKPSAKKTQSKRKGKNDGDDENENGDLKMPKIIIKDYKEYSSTTRVHFKVYSPYFSSMSDAEIEKELKQTCSISITNMHLFDELGKIKKYPSAEDILKYFFIVRMKFYGMRKEYMLAQVEKDLRIHRNRLRFIKAVISKELVVANRKKKDLIKELQEKNYDPIPKTTKKLYKTSAIDDSNEDNQDEDEIMSLRDTLNDAGARNYDYLLSMPIWSLTLERIKNLEDILNKKQFEHDQISALTPADLWERDLDAFEDAWNRFNNNMTILDEVGVGGCAFRKPNIPRAEGGSNMTKKKREEMINKLKKLTTLQSQDTLKKSLVSSKPNRNEVIMPVVKLDPIIPIKKELNDTKAKMKVDVKNEYDSISNNSFQSDISNGINNSTASTLEKTNGSNIKKEVFDSSLLSKNSTNESNISKSDLPKNQRKIKKESYYSSDEDEMEEDMHADDDDDDDNDNDEIDENAFANSSDSEDFSFKTSTKSSRSHENGKIQQHDDNYTKGRKYNVPINKKKTNNNNNNNNTNNGNKGRILKKIVVSEEDSDSLSLSALESKKSLESTRKSESNSRLGLSQERPSIQKKQNTTSNLSKLKKESFFDDDDDDGYDLLEIS